MNKLSVNDVFNSSIGFGPGQKIELNGLLIVSQHLSYITISESQQEKSILVIAPGIFDEFLEQIAVRCGTMVGFIGNATITGTISKSGMKPLPYAIYNIDSIIFHEIDGSSARYAPKGDAEFDYFDTYDQTHV